MSAAEKFPDPDPLASATPAIRQYLQLKAQYEDCLLFYRMGDFYELFFEDAHDAVAIVDIALTHRGKHAGKPIPMCGVPVHSHESYLQKLIASGRKVAICEQMETPEEAKKRAGHKAVVNREVVRVVTPGTITEENLLAPDQAHYLAALAGQGANFALAWLDVSTGQFFVAAIDKKNLAAELSRIAPKELLASDTLADSLKDWCDVLSLQPASQFDARKAERTLLSHYAIGSLEPLGELSKPEIAACGALLEYLKLTQLEQLPRLDLPQKQQASAALLIDSATRRNLELTRTLSGSKPGSLLWVIDRTLTGPGGRLLSSWLTSPLTDAGQIRARQEVIAFALEQQALCDEMRGFLKETPDMERAAGRLCMNRGGPRDLQVIKMALLAVQNIKQRLDVACAQVAFAKAMPESLKSLMMRLGEHGELINTLSRALKDELPMLARDGNFIAQGYRADLDDVRALRDDSKRVIAQMQSEYAAQSGITGLKIKFNNVLGYFIEIGSAHEKKVPEHFIHRQSLANNMRYTTTQLSETASAIAQAQGRALQLELETFDKLLAMIVQAAEPLLSAARALAQLDVYLALADLAQQGRYVCPQMDDSRDFIIEGARHPVVESALARSGDAFIANDCDLSPAQQLWLLTGPNMAGKSTFLRQNALMVILAQMGSFVPAKAAKIGIVDRLFSRVGAADDLARGQSTFMVEMVETATILNQASDRSLVILDEIGRGTATYDGLSIAWAVVEHLHERTQCRALFATHYHELTQLSASLARLSCHTMQVKEWQGQVVFLHQVKAGTADRSYGIHVAQLAGLPREVTKRARAVLADLERRGQGALAVDLPLFAAQSSDEQAQDEPHPALQALSQIDPDELTPKAALEALYRLKEAAG